MATALTALTTQPIRQDLIAYGNNLAANENDVVRKSSEGFLGRLVSWERDASNSCCPSAVKAWILFFVDKLFAVLDWVGIGPLICYKGLQETKNIRMLEQATPERNRMTFEQHKIAREQVIDALGGPDALRDVPVVQLQEAHLQQDLSIGDDYFPQGHWKIQGEDPAGRKFVALRVQLREVEIPARERDPAEIHRDIQTTHIITIHQYRRETAGYGNVWRINFDFGYPGRGHLHKFQVFSQYNEPNLLVRGPRNEDPQRPIGLSFRDSFRALQEAGSMRVSAWRHAGLFRLLPPRTFTFEQAPKP